MSYKAPSAPAPTKPQDPLINMAELQQATDLQKKQRGYMSTYLQGNKAQFNRLSSYLTGQTAKQTTLGSSI